VPAHRWWTASATAREAASSPPRCGSRVRRIVIRGRAPEPVYLWLHDGKAELRPGRSPLGNDHLGSGGPHPRGTRGPQGRGGRRGACRREARPPGRSHEHGLPGQRPHRHGRRHGLKNLKAIAVRGASKKIPSRREAPQRPGPLRRRRHSGNADVLDLQQNGTAGVVEYQHGLGTLPPSTTTRASSRLRGHQRHHHNGDDPEGERHLLRLRGALQAGGGDRVAGPGRGAPPRGPEYESIGTLGSTAGRRPLRHLARQQDLQ